MIKLGLIGYGYWGPNLLRNFSLREDCTVKVLADLSSDRLNAAKKSFPYIRITQDPDDVPADPSLDAIIIATPVHLHFPLAQKALLEGKHVLIEKPMCTNLNEAETLVSLANKKNRVLMIDHTFLYSGAVQTIKKIIKKGEIGSLLYFDSTRINLGLFQSDINVIWDLAVHDLSILLHLTEEKPDSIIATGISHTPNNLENLSYLFIRFPGRFVAHISSSWSSPVKIRKILIGGTEKMIVYDDVEPTEKIKVYDTGYKIKNDEDKHKVLVDYRTGDIFVPKINQTEALSLLAEDFIESIKENRKPLSDANTGLEVVKILEAAQKSIKMNGKEINIS